MLSWLAMGAAAYASVAVVGRLGYRTLLYPAPRRGLDAPPPGAELMVVTASDGKPVQLVAHPALDEAPDRLLVFFHGNGETVADSVALARAIVARGVGFVAVEYRGYGTSPSEGPTEAGLYADAEGALRALAERGIGPERITLWGNSLGTGVAVEMARRGLGARLLLQAPYTSIPEVAARIAPFLPLRLLIDDTFDSGGKAAALRQPTLVLHGDRDRVIPYAMGVALAERIPDAELVTVVGGDHGDLFVLERERLIARIVAFALSEA